MWKLRIGVLVSSGLLAVATGGPAWATTASPNGGSAATRVSSGGPTSSPSVTPVTSISAITISRARHGKAEQVARKTHKKKVICHKRPRNRRPSRKP